MCAADMQPRELTLTRLPSAPAKQISITINTGKVIAGTVGGSGPLS